MRRSVGRRHLAVALLAVALAVVIVVVSAANPLASGTGEPASRTLVVADGESDVAVLEIPVGQETEVTLAYTHSVEKTPVEDVYVVEDDALRMDRTVFRSSGAGLPSDAALELTDDGWVRHVDRTFDRLHVVPGEIAGHELVVDGDRYDLVSLADGPVVIRVTSSGEGDSTSSGEGDGASSVEGDGTPSGDTAGSSDADATPGVATTDSNTLEIGAVAGRTSIHAP